MFAIFRGGAFEIFLAKNGVKVHGYDNFKYLVCFWSAVKKDKQKLHEIISNNYPITKERFYDLQRTIHLLTDETEIAAMFYILNRCSFSGTTLSGGMSPNHPRFNKKQIDSILNFDDALDFKVQEMSFEYSIPKHDCLIYADPPYLIDEKLYGVKGSMHKGFNHILLAHMLNDRGNFILSYNNCDEIKEMYSGYGHDFYYPKWKYGMGTDKNSTEILIVSKDLK